MERLDLHYTPKHGGWLNVAEIELSTLGGQCLDRRIADRETLEREAAAREEERNAFGRGGRLAVHDRGRPDQAEAALPVN